MDEENTFICSNASLKSAVTFHENTLSKIIFRKYNSYNIQLRFEALMAVKL
jgi:hypothetical protein